MPRPRTQIQPHLDYAELTRRYIQCQDAGEKNRWLVIRLLSHPKTPMSVEQTAEICGLSCSGVRKIARRYNTQGADGLVNRQQFNPGGNRLALSDEQQQQLRQRLEHPPDDGGLWSGPKVGEYIATHFGLRLHPSTAWQYLRRLGLRLQVPRPLHHQSAPLQQQAEFKAGLAGYVAWLRSHFPHWDVEIWAEDEARLGLQPVIRRVWAPIGKRPTAHHCRRYQWVYTYGFVQPDTGASYFLLLPRANVSMMQLALELFATEVNSGRQRLIILLVDQAAWHLSQKLRVPAGIFLYPLLPYTPQLQPTECVWPLLREAVANQVFENLDALEEVLVKRCQWLMQHPTIVQGSVGFDWIQAL